VRAGLQNRPRPLLLVFFGERKYNQIVPIGQRRNCSIAIRA
jgi:hypothetical protein